MILTIDNLDGAGAMDYSEWISADGPLTIERTLNAPSRLTGSLDVGRPANPGGAPTLRVPVRRARVVASSELGTILFTGYLATEPVPVYAGAGVAGAVYRFAFSAISDEWLLDKQTLTLGGDGFAVAGGTLLAKLTNRIEAGLLSTSGVVSDKAVGVFTPQPAKPFSVNAGGIASSAYAAYRAINGTLAMQTVGSATHALNFDAGDDGTLQVAALKTAMVKELANDVTLSGEMEPSAYVSELFSGDGTTAVFTMSEEPLRLSKPARLTDSFDRGAIERQSWSVTDPGSHFSLGSNGLTLAGGTGADGQTTLTALDMLELGGSLLLEAGSVRLAAPSDGVICGVYSGPVERTNCFAGFNVRQSGGTTLLTPLLNGTEVGTSYILLAGHSYTLRIRLHSPEMQRVRQTYYARVEGAIEAFGGGLIDSPMACVFELVDLGDSSNTPATVLYDGPVAESPASCSFALVNSISLTGSVGFGRVTQEGSAWIVSTLPGGAKQTRLIGVAGEGTDCKISATGVVTFFAGRVPVAGETVTMTYRTRSRAVARLEDAASIAAETAGGAAGTARWLGRVLRPQARSSEDCEAAAQATLSLASSRSAALAGSYAAVNPADVWPGDVLAITANGQTFDVVARAVEIVDGHARPEILNYRVSFANDWAESLGITLSETIAADVYLPTEAATAPAQVIANLQSMTVVSATTTALQVDAGSDPPVGGGFEVRLRDFDFGAGVDQNLVLRSPVRSFSIPRAAQVERYYVRMYDGSTPRLYSRHSSAVFTNLPVA